MYSNIIDLFWGHSLRYALIANEFSLLAFEIQGFSKKYFLFSGKKLLFLFLFPYHNHLQHQ